MPKTREDEQALLDAADKIEARLARAIALAMQRLRSRIPLEVLARAISSADARMAANAIGLIDVEDVLKPSGEILRDAFMKGGKVGAQDVRNG